MSNGYDLTAGITEIIDSYLDNKSKERIAYTKMMQPEIKVVDGNLIKYDPSTGTASPVGGDTMTDMYFNKATKVYTNYTRDNMDPFEALSTQGSANEVQKSLESGTITGKTSYDHWNNVVFKNHTEVADYNVLSQFEGVKDMNIEIPQSEFNNFFGMIEMGEDPQNPGVQIPMGVTENSKLHQIINTSSVDVQRKFIQNVEKWAISNRRLKRKDKVDEMQAQKKELRTASQNLRSTINELKKSQNILNQMEAFDYVAKGDVSPKAKEYIEALEMYNRALYGSRDVIHGLNAYQYQSTNGLSRQEAIDSEVWNKEFLEDLQEVEDAVRDAEGGMIPAGFMEKLKESHFKTVTVMEDDPQNPGVKIPKKDADGNNIEVSAWTVDGLSQLSNRFVALKKKEGWTSLMLEDYPVIQTAMLASKDDTVLNNFFQNAVTNIDQQLSFYVNNPIK